MEVHRAGPGSPRGPASILIQHLRPFRPENTHLICGEFVTEAVITAGPYKEFGLLSRVRVRVSRSFIRCRRRTIRGAAMSILLLNAPPVDALSQEPYRVLYSVGAEESPAEQVFDEHITVALSRSGILFVAETRIGSIRVFDSSGRFVRQFGRRGEGPGEYLSITSMAVGPAGDSLYVFDHKNRRVSVLSPTGTLLREFRPQLEWSGPLQMERHTSGALLFIGHSAKHRGLVHVVDPKGTYIRSFGDLLEIDDHQHDTPLMQAQLLQGQVCELSDGDLLVALRAPYVVARFALDGRRRWVVRDDVLPKPWIKHIVAAERSYRVASYPSVTGLDALGNGVFRVMTTDFERERKFLDTRRASDGTLTDRQAINFGSHQRLLCPVAGARPLGLLFKSDPFPSISVITWPGR